MNRKRSMKRWISLFSAVILLITTFLPAGLIQKVNASISEQVVISQVYGAGGNSGALFNKDFIELYNPTDQPVSLDNWSIQYASAGGTSWTSTSLSGEIPAYGYYLITQAGGANGAEVPTADASSNVTMAATAGKVKLIDGDKNQVDLVGFGSSANQFEGSGPTPAPSTTKSVQRRPYANVIPESGLGNAWDSDDNALDFVAASPVPKNSASQAEPPMESDTSLQPVGNNVQFTLQDGKAKVTGVVAAAAEQSVIKVYETSAKGTALESANAADDGSFTIIFTTEKALTSVFVTATQEGKNESDAIQINLAQNSKNVVAEKLSYSVDNKGKGTLIGNADAGVARSTLYVYPNSSANKAERLNGTGTEVLGTGAFNAITFNNAPATIYVTQQSSDSKGIMLESVPVSVEKAATDVVTPLNEVKETDSKGYLVNLNQFFTVEGVVTVENGVMGTQKNNFYIQDETAGINIFGSYDSGLKIVRGDKLKITGKLIQYNGLTELDATAITKMDEGQAIPAPKDVSVLDLNTFTVAEPLEGSLVRVNGKVSSIATSGSNWNVTFVDENNKSTTVRVMDKTGIKADEVFESGKNYAVSGIVGQYTTNSTHVSGYQVFPRDMKDITAQLSIDHKPMTEVYKDTAVEFVAKASGAESVIAYYRATDAADYIALSMTAGSESRYTAVLQAENVPVEGFDYYIEALAGESVQSSGTKEAPHQVTLVEDKDGPRIYGEAPVGGSKVESPRPEISVLLEDPSGVDQESVNVLLDGAELTNAQISQSQVKFTPEEDLALGDHTIKVTALDLKGNSSEYEWTFTVVPRFEGGNHYRGTTHNHTKISHDGAGEPEAALKAGQKYNYDWFAFSDHSHDIDPTLLGQDTVERDGMFERSGGSDWKLTKDLSAQYTKDGEYVVFPAFEMTSTTWGHSNIFGTENFIDRNINGKMYQDLNKYYAWVMTYDDVVGQFNHPDMSKDAFNNFKPYNKDMDKLFTMLEVGNGSGHYGYANAERKFFSVLDLGWHVAPTYGEDNHEGTWGQTRARTVIVAEDLSQESLLHSMRNMRVYMVEDPNFQLDVKANGFYMGSTVDSKSLQFNISGSDAVAESRSMDDYSYLPADYKSDDRVEKVELISNGGIVVDSYSPMAADFSWEPSYTVSGGQQWFVVRVTQADGERMYSAPIWSKEEAVDVKVNGIDIVGDVIVEGNPATLKASVANNGTQEVKNLKVDLYFDEVKAENLIGSQDISSIPSKGVAAATAVWESPLKGDHKIIAVVSSLDGLNLGDNQFVLPVKIKEPLGINVVIDAKHGNENTSGDGGTYKDNLKAFTTMMQKEGYKVTENTSVITDAVLSNVDVFVITNPRSAYTADESAAIAKFVKNGGSLLMAGKSNHSTNPAINNGMLEQMGATIRMGNDGVFDDSKTGNFWSDPKVAPFAVRAFPGLVSNYITDRVSFLDYYSGTSLSGPNDTALTESGKVVILAKGNETTYQGNIKGGYTYDAVSDATGGSAIPLIASEEIGEKGRVIVSGMNIFNDKQIDESYEPKGNDEFALNAVNWLAHRETKITDIGQARKLAENSETVIEGTVTTGAGVFFDAFYVQDDTGGIMAFQEVPAGSIKPGDKVRIYGHIITFDNNKEIEFVKFEQDVIKIGEGTPLEPKPVPTGEATSDLYQGLLVKVKGEVVEKFDENSYVVNDGSGDVLVFTDGYIVNQSGPVPVLEVGDTLEAIGLSGSFAQGTRIRVRDTKELIGTVGDRTAPETTAAVNPEAPTGENGWHTSDVTLTLAAKDDKSGVATTQYRFAGEENWTEYIAPIELKEDGVYTIEFRSKDVRGNVEEVNSIDVKIDKAAPELNITVDKPILLIPNQKLIDIKASLDTNDATSGIQSVVLKSITMNDEKQDETDIKGADFNEDDREFALRATRGEKGKERIYTITYTVTDNAGHKTTASTTVTVKKGR